MIDVSHLTYRYGDHVALSELNLSVPEGGLYALLGPNGSGKTTLLQIIMGLRRAHQGRVQVMGRDVDTLTIRDRGEIGYIAEGQPLPGWMRLDQLEQFLAPLYPHWDHALARDLREEFELDPRRKISVFSRGEYMKAALLCALAPRPKLLIMDEPFTGMDALVKDDLVRGLLRSSGSEGWTVLLCSHDIGELELLADHVGLIDRGQMRLSTTMDDVRSRFHKVDAVAPSAIAIHNAWLAAEEAGHRVSFVVEGDAEVVRQELERQLPAGSRIEMRSATLREVFIALSRSRPRRTMGVAA
jgi:ABC-2 type transport system ATP-binding protein